MSEARFDEPEYEEPAQAAAEAPADAETPEAPPAAETKAVEDEVKPVPTVPLSALNEARHTIRELKEAQAQQAQRDAQLRAELNEWRKQQQQTQQVDGFQKDPLGSIHQELQTLKQTQEAATNETRMREQQAAQIQQFTQAVSTRVQEFTKVTPDYPDALTHLVESRKRELLSLGMPEHQLDAVIDQESVQLANTALQTGRNPGEVVYELAKQRGYTGKKPAAKGPNLDTIEKGIKAAQTLSEGGGDSTVKLPSLSDIAKMSDEEFGDWQDNSADSPWAKPAKKKR